MITSIDLLDAAKAKLCINSDYAFAKEIGATKQCISLIRKNRTCFGVYHCVALAEILELEPFAVVASIQCESARKVADTKKENVFFKYTNGLLISCG